jgi:hypothetical protein
MRFPWSATEKRFTMERPGSRCSAIRFRIETPFMAAKQKNLSFRGFTDSLSMAD